MNRRGFTLIELLVVIALLSVVSTLAVQAFSSITDFSRTNAVRMELAVRAARAFEQIQRDFDRVISTRRSGVAIRGQRLLDEVHRYERVPLKSDSVVLPIETPADTSGNDAAAQSAMYHIDRDNGVPRLVCTFGPLGANPPAGAQQPIADGVLAMEVNYFDGKAWLPEWKAETNPRAVRITLTLQDPTRTWEQITRQADFQVFVP